MSWLLQNIFPTTEGREGHRVYTKADIAHINKNGWMSTTTDPREYSSAWIGKFNCMTPVQILLMEIK